MRGVHRLLMHTAEEAHSLFSVQERMFIWHSKFTPPYTVTPTIRMTAAISVVRNAQESIHVSYACLCSCEVAK